MIAVDTNVLVRLIAADHDEQSPRALALFAANRIWIALTVVLETEWVLRSSRGMQSAAVIGALRAVAALPNVEMEHADRLARALDWSGQGMDFADALHLAAAERCDAFVTFDRGLIAMAGKDAIARPARTP